MIWVWLLVLLIRLRLCMQVRLLNLHQSMRYFTIHNILIHGAYYQVCHSLLMIQESCTPFLVRRHPCTRPLWAMPLLCVQNMPWKLTLNNDRPSSMSLIPIGQKHGFCIPMHPRPISLKRSVICMKKYCKNYLNKLGFLS